MGLYRSLSGVVEAELVSADLPSMLRVIQNSGIEIQNIDQKDSLTLTFQIRRSDIGKLHRIISRRGDTLRTKSQQGIFWTIRAFFRRPVLVIGLALILLLSLILPSRVLFVRVEGNVTVPTRRILEEAASCGITLGASTRQVRSETIKNQLLSKIDDLQWAGINTYGCVAVISVKERTPEQSAQTFPQVSSIVARRDGIVISIVTEQGSPLCRPGDAVTAGQKLISGYSDCGISIRATQAKGEVLALTEHQITVVSPTQYESRGEILTTRRNYSILIGKNRINFCKYSGILDARCARIYSTWYVTLPGGFVLPIGFVVEETITYAPADPATEEVDLSAYAKQYVLSQSAAGQILSAVETTQTEDQIVIFRGRYACRESLGITRIEEDFENYGKDP